MDLHGAATVRMEPARPCHRNEALSAFRERVFSMNKQAR